MKRGTTTGLLGFALLLGAAVGAQADLKENPYQVIIDRNPFALRPIPPPAPPPAAVETNVPPPAPDLKLTGITTLLGTARVMLQYEDKQTKKTEFPPPLAVGGSYKTLEVLAIDVDAGTVKVRNGDAESTLDFINNGVKATASAAPVPGLPGAPGLPPGVPRPPGAPVTPAGSPTGSAIIGGGQSTAAVPPPAPGTGYNPAGGVPQRNVRTDSLLISGSGGQPFVAPGTAVPQPATQQPALSSMDAQALIEAKRMELQAREAAGQMQRGQPSSRILPPTALGNAARNVPPPQ